MFIIDILFMLEYYFGSFAVPSFSFHRSGSFVLVPSFRFLPSGSFWESMTSDLGDTYELFKKQKNDLRGQNMISNDLR